MITHEEVLKLSVGDEVVVVGECSIPVGSKLKIVSVDRQPMAYMSLKCRLAGSPCDSTTMWVYNEDVAWIEQDKQYSLSDIVDLIARGGLGEGTYEATDGRIGDIAYVGEELYWLDDAGDCDELVEINNRTASTVFKLKQPELKRNRYVLKDIYRNIVKFDYRGDYLNYDVSENKVKLLSGEDLAGVRTLFTEEEFHELPNTDGLKDLVEIRK